MNLGLAAGFFDSVPVADGYTGQTLFNAQLEPYDDSRRDSVQSGRRILATRPDVVAPSRGVVGIGADRWILGQRNPDWFQGVEIRSKYVMAQADGLATLGSIQEHLAGSGTVQAYYSKSWVKDSKDIEESSARTGVYHFYMARSETVEPGDMIVSEGQTYIVQQSYITTLGMIAAEADQLGAALVSATLTPVTYNVVTEAEVVGTAITASALSLRWQSHFRYLSESSPKFNPGDSVVVMRATGVPAPTTSDNLQVNGTDYRILAAHLEDSLWKMHVEAK